MSIAQEFIACGFILTVLFFPQQFWHITVLLLGIPCRIVALALTLVAKIVRLIALTFGRAIKFVFTYPRYALASAVVAYLLVRLVGHSYSDERVSLPPTHRARGGYGATSGGLGALSLFAAWRVRCRRAKERVGEEARRQAAEHEDREREWAREEAERRRRAEAKRQEEERAEAKRREDERMAREREEERRSRQREQERAGESVAAAWAAYLRRWDAIERGNGPLTFGTVPWPVVGMPKSTADLTPNAIAAFVLSPAHSHGESGKDRIKQALLRWHPDRFRRYLERVKTGDRVRVENRVGCVARCLCDLREKENA